MSVLIRPAGMNISQPDGSTKQFDIVNFETTAQALAKIEAKKQQALEDIPDEYTELAAEVSRASKIITNIDGDTNDRSLWEQGRIAATGNNSASVYRIRTIGFIHDGIVQVTCSNDFSVFVYAYDGEGVFLGGWTGSGFHTTTVSAFKNIDLREVRRAAGDGAKLRLLLRAKGNTDLVTTDDYVYCQLFTELHQRLNNINPDIAEFDYFLGIHGDADDAFDAALQHCKDNGVHVIHFNAKRYVFGRSHVIDMSVLLVKGEKTNSTFTGIVYNMPNSSLFVVQNSGICFEGLTFISSSYTQTVDLTDFVFTHSESIESVSAITAAHNNVEIDNCIFLGFSNYAIMAYNQSKVRDCIIKNCKTAIEVVGYDGQYRDIYITSCGYAFADHTTPTIAKTIDIYNLWADQIEYDVFRFYNQGGIITGCIIDLVGGNVFRCTTNITRLYVSGKISHYGMTDSELPQDHAMVNTNGIVDSHFDVLTYTREEDQHRDIPEYWISAAVRNSVINDAVAGSDVFGGTGRIVNTTVHTPGSIWLFDADGNKRTL